MGWQFHKVPGAIHFATTNPQRLRPTQVAQFGPEYAPTFRISGLRIPQCQKPKWIVIDQHKRLNSFDSPWLIKQLKKYHL